MRGRRIHFDESLPAFVSILLDTVPRIDIEKTVFVRDNSGRLAAFVDQDIEEDTISAISEAIAEQLGAYARSDRVLADRNAYGSEQILQNFDDAATVHIPGTASVRLIDRRIVGMDWMRPPAGPSARPPRFVFSSLKGGVGRSTALCIVAADQAREGRNVLAIDLDLEAPGIGAMLLPPERLPVFGALDVLVENSIGGFDDHEIAKSVGVSPLTIGQGLVHVVPAYGQSSLQNPENYLSKLSRALTEDVSSDTVLSLRDQIATLVARFESQRDYDLVLIDCRAGLAEIAAGPILGLGAHVLLFGTPQRQTFEGYQYLFAALAPLARSGGNLTWRERFQVVMAKAPIDDSVIRSFTDDMHQMFSESIYDEAEPEELEAFNFDPRDPAAPHFPIVVPFDGRFVSWDPHARPSDLAQALYENTFRNLLEYFTSTIAAYEND